jgi:hypothetical protein
MNVAVWVTIAGVVVGDSIVTQIGFALLAVPLVLVVTMLFLRHRYFAAAGEEFGLKVTWRHPVPIEADRFETWCNTHGVIPYGNRDKD